LFVYASVVAVGGTVVGLGWGCLFGFCFEEMLCGWVCLMCLLKASEC
jgi:hypothetical protein